MRLRIHHFQYVGGIVFIGVGMAMLFAGVLQPSDALTDDGEPLGPFLLGMGGIFGGTGLLWALGAFMLIRYLDKKRATLEALRAHLRAHGLRVMARVILCESTGYMNFENEAWTNLTIEIAVPGFPPRQRSMHIALPQAVLDAARSHHTIALLVDGGDPDRFVLADGGG